MYKQWLHYNCIVSLLTLLAVLAGCHAEDSNIAITSTVAPMATRPAIDSLDQSTAKDRKARLSNIEYAIDIVLEQENDTFSGEVTIRFDLADEHGVATDLSLDFAGGKVLESTLNGSDEDIPYNGFFLSLPGKHLKAGANTLTIRFNQFYGHDGTGLHRFVDPVDHRVYLYSYLWPYYANRIFPCFDQPNLKARFTLNVEAPSKWNVVSTSSGEPESTTGDSTRRWRFQTTPQIASYAFSLHAGPYTVWEADADGIPMRLMARQSLAEYVAVDEWFEVTRKGLAYYRDYFDIPYPFGKYDQLIVPDFAIGAMENIAAVTFNEQRYVQRQTSDRAQRERRASTILHEMAHMWFGDLVTHQWWNGMWLNESFATQMSAMAMLATTGFDDTWHGFFTDDKQQAYRADSRVTTHPVEVPVNSTIDFFQVFDAITYQKGASVLKQLAHYVGEEKYRLGVSAYLKANAYSNTELDDFINFQSQTSGKDISAWADEWLYQPGFNTLAAKALCSEDQLQSLSITQTAPTAYPTLRHHQVDVALYAQASEGNLLAPTVIPVTIAGAETELDLPANLPCPALINPNHNDWTLAQFELDERSLETLNSHLSSIPEPLARSMFLAALYHRSMSGQDSLASYLELAMRLAETENVIRIQQQISDSVIATVSLMQRLRPETDEALATWLPVLEAKFLQMAGSADTGDVKRTWFNTFLGVAWSESGMGTLNDLLDGSLVIPGLPISADLRWQILGRLAGSGQLDIDALIAAELAADDSDFGLKNSLAAQAARPNLKQKASWLAELQNPESLTGLSRQRAVLGGLFPADQTELQSELLDDILQSLPTLSHKVDPYFMTSYVSTLLQPICLPESVNKMQLTLDETTDQLDSTALRFLREAHEADAECLELRKVQ